MFSIPSSLPLTSKVVWAVFAYMLWDTAYTICDVPAFGLVTTMTENLPERTTLMAIGRIAAGAGSFIVSVTVPLVRQAIGGWLPTTAALSAAALFFMAPLCFLARERVMPRNSAEDISFAEMARFLRNNKYIFIYFGAFVLARTFDVVPVLNMYFARYYLGSESYLSIISIVSAAPYLVVAALIPLVCKKVDKFVLFYWCTVLGIVVSVISWFVGYHSIAAVVIMSVLRGIPTGFLGVLMFMFTPDCVEYGTWKTGISASGTAFSLQTFSAKLLAAFAAAAGAAALSFIGFIEGEGAVQTDGFADKLFLVYSLLPAIGSLIALPLLARYKLRDKDVQIMARYNSGAISREEADALLGRSL
jgi:Na+/melibiose symporter-like transporter